MKTHTFLRDAGTLQTVLPVIAIGTALGILSSVVKPSLIVLCIVSAFAAIYALRKEPVLLVYYLVVATLFLPAIPIPGTSSLDFSLNLVALGLLAVGFLVTLLSERWRKLPNSRYTAIVVLVGLVGFISLSKAFLYFDAITVIVGVLYLGQWMLYLAAPVLIAYYAHSERSAKRLLAFTLLASTVMTLYFLTLLVLGIRPNETTIRIAGLRPLVGFWEQSQLAVGMFLALTATVGWGLVLELEDAKYRVALLPLVGLSAFLTLTTLSRSSILALAIGLTLPLFVKAPRKAIISTAVGFLLVAAVAPDFLVERLTRSTFYMREVPALDREIPLGAIAVRVSGWVQLAPIFAENPIFGVGFSLSRFRALQLYGEAVAPDNHYVGRLVETGIVGMALFALWARDVISKLWAVYQHDDRVNRGLSLGLIGGFSGFLVWGFFQGFYARWRVLGPLMVYLGVVFSMYNRKREVDT